ncbi:wd40 repeat-containing protein : WD domain, G-beta repeat-containing protein,protein kinase family protein OS=Singulisphaera acidiphila (strain ATCC BAA-1392 / DSM 18658 / VKM B-2454 / MOB10) GN=Sinac_1615 PE=4 SV=1: Pkinase: WD40: WD40: WD40: WD40: WD40: WD40: WD40 [Gemmata massiliana]|uniref:Protein kinase domain-containing protein n=1 Tax=Gemmata massiliana TaxID=1210884 RepID=A0A6P2D457_9BACT|nr:protein kinase [Gemmata massiliana]VTR95215.1 wd40 repeat-containing protein : WD domain, G-beta repeat-containing protein,protein kinase family protein OS=Singulisphaera acidiphila (strain ATCC BAA-1392 / DSM 18658 / VKM B-2454 / MOB10) GN=Sinac_1615 PE=4 SV=1: Pkinase: WD40: WD40: WD40: WD40: WD40: WD40: WD40 [Gemmata massiliana]
MTNDCPSESELRAFSLGDLPDGRLDAVGDHLERCPRCETRIGGLDRSTDGFISAVRGAAARPPVAPPPTGRVGEYEILSELGRGGMGVVYKARHERLRRVVALKVLLGGQFASAEHRTRFRAEAELVARLQHPNIVQIFEAGEWTAPDGSVLPYLALEFAEGGTLARRADRPQPPPRAAVWVEALARAVESAHRQGVIHRDLKPSNVLFTADGQLKLCDFGVAKLQSSADARTTSGLLVGPPEYMAPEQAAGRSQTAGPATDVWGLGAILYVLLTGRPPFQAPDALGVLQMLQHDSPVPPRQLQSGVPRDLETICLKCLRTEPAHRYPGARELADDLRRFIEHRPIVARPVGPVGRATKWARRHPGSTGLLAALALVVAVAFALVSWQWREAVHQHGLADQRADAEAGAKAQAELNAEREKVARHAAETLLAGAVIDEALGMCERGNVRLGLCRLAYGLELAVSAGDPALENAARLNLGAWGHQCVREAAVLPHNDWVWSVALSPDGKTALTAGKDNKAGLWDTATGRSRAVLSHPHPVWAAVFSPDGRTVLTGCGSTDGKEGEARLWDVATGAAVGPALAHVGCVTRVAFRPDGRAFFTASAVEGQLWDTAIRDRLGAALRPDNGPLMAACFSPDGRRLLTGSGGGSLQLWNATTAAPDAPKLEGPKAAVWAVAFSPDGRSIAAGGDGGTVRVYDAGTGAAGAVLRHRGRAYQVTFSPDGRLLAAGVAAGALDLDNKKVIRGEARVWRTSDWEPLHPALEHPGPVWAVAFSPSGGRLMTGCEDGKARLFETATGASIGHPLAHEGTVRTVCFSPNGRTALTASAGWTGRGRVWELPPERDLPLPLSHPQPVCALTFGADAEALTTCCTGGVLRHWPLKSGAPASSRLEGAPELVLARFDGTGRSIAAIATPYELRVWDVKTSRLVWEAPKREQRPVYALGPDGTHFLEGTAAGLILRRIPPGAGEGPTMRHSPPLRLAALSPDGQTALMAGGPRVRLWALPSGHPQGDWDVPAEVSAAAFSPDGLTVALGDGEGAVQLWNLRTGRPVGPRMNHRRTEIAAVVFSADGLLIGTAGGDGTARLWDAATGRAVGPPLPHRGPVGAIAFHPHVGLLASGHDRVAQIWPVPTPVRGGVAEVSRSTVAVTGIDWDRSGRPRDLPDEELRHIRSP